MDEYASAEKTARSDFRAWAASSEIGGLSKIVLNVWRALYVLRIIDDMEHICI